MCVVKIIKGMAASNDVHAIVMADPNSKDFSCCQDEVAEGYEPQTSEGLDWMKVSLLTKFHYKKTEHPL